MSWTCLTLHFASRVDGDVQLIQGLAAYVLVKRMLTADKRAVAAHDFSLCVLVSAIWGSLFRRLLSRDLKNIAITELTTP